jgi:hypothetical protein
MKSGENKLNEESINENGGSSKAEMAKKLGHRRKRRHRKRDRRLAAS